MAIRPRLPAHERATLAQCLTPAHLVDPVSPGAYHCVSRCVRRAFLCGQDKESGQDFEHRRSWLEDRIHKQTSAFAISVYAYAVMSNHVHLVLHVDPGLVANWDDHEIQARYRLIFPKKPNKNGVIETVAPDDLKKWRERLGSLSWFMRALCEPRIRSPANQQLQQQVQTLPRAHEEERGLPTRKMAAPGGSGKDDFSPRPCSMTGHFSQPWPMPI